MGINLQDTCLSQIKKDNTVVIIYLVNGFQIKGTVKGYDNFTVIVETEGKIQMVYKHAISTINMGKVNLTFIGEAFKPAPSAE